MAASGNQAGGEVEAVAPFRCTRTNVCRKVLARQYFKSTGCEHKFCLNCKRFYERGTRNYKCPIRECTTRFREHEWERHRLPQEERVISLDPIVEMRQRMTEMETQFEGERLEFRRRISQIEATLEENKTNMDAKLEGLCQLMTQMVAQIRES